MGRWVGDRKAEEEPIAELMPIRFSQVDPSHQR